MQPPPAAGFESYDAFTQSVVLGPQPNVLVRDAFDVSRLKRSFSRAALA
jgi:hypothetical protein